jgi:hypothetical protein
MANRDTPAISPSRPDFSEFQSIPILLNVRESEADR